MLDRGALRLFSFQGIPVRLHWTFGFLLLWVLYIGLSAGMEWQAIGVMGLVILSLFACVVLHEFGHALAARRYGVRTRDIILSPIGGVARLDRLPEKPLQELVVALAGPLVNVVIALVLGVLGWLFVPQGLQILGESESAMFWIGNYVPLLFWMNIWLVVFNMIPAFPMDGGRVLRALLAWRVGRLKATRWASVVGRVLAGVFLILAFYLEHLFLGLVGLFVYVMATQEYKMVRTEALYSRFRAGDVLRTAFTLLHPLDTVSDALLRLQQGLETTFLVGESRQRPEGYITGRELIRCRDNGHAQTSLAHFVRPVPAVVRPAQPLVEVFPFFQQDKEACVLVADEAGQVLGLIDSDQIDHVMYWAEQGRS